MKHRIIRINDVSEIDTSKVSIYDLNNRYIDKAGNMYGLKYDRLSRRVDIIKLVRTHSSNAGQVHQEIIRNRKVQQKSKETQTELADDTSLDTEEDLYDFFDPDMFIDGCLELMKTHRERLRGVMMNIKNSNVFPRENKNETVVLEDIFRNIDIDSIQEFEKVENYQRELTNYPKSITYYQAKIDERGRGIIEGLANNTVKIMRFIYLYEMHSSLKHAYSVTKKLVIELIELVQEKNTEDLTNFSTAERQSYNDAIVSLQNTVNEIDDLFHNLRSLEDFVTRTENL